MSELRDINARRSIRRHLVVGFAAVTFLVGGLGSWAYFTELAGAVVASGLLVVDSYVKKVQHPTGGVVGEIYVREGEHVRAGQVVLRLDETVARANLAIVENGLNELAARRGRLEAERDGRDAFVVPSRLVARADDAEVMNMLLGETRLLESRRDARNGQRLQLRERIAQLKEQIDGLNQQSDAKSEEIKLIQEELMGVQLLFRKNLVPVARLTALMREETRLKGERGQLLAGVAQAKGRISEIELQIIQIDQELRSEVTKDLREVQIKTAELTERKVAAEDQLKRIEIRAPQDGIVHQLAVHTVGGVIAPGDTIMQIVPEGDDLTAEVKIAAQDIDQLQFGQPTILRLSAFNQRSTPELKGVVSRIAADLVTDQRTGQMYYPVRISFTPGEQERLSGLKLIPGMPVESFVQTGERTVLSYLTKPLTDQVLRAFRAE